MTGTETMEKLTALPELKFWLGRAGKQMKHRPIYVQKGQCLGKILRISPVKIYRQAAHFSSVLNPCDLSASTAGGDGVLLTSLTPNTW